PLFTCCSVCVASNLLPKERPPPPHKPKMYISKYREAVVFENKYNKHAHRTMGPGTVEAPSHREMCPQKPKSEKPEGTCRKKVPLKPQPACVDTIKGDKQLLEKSGLVPFYVKKPDYGSVPGYLRRQNAEKERAKREYDAWPLPEEEKQKILQGLKRRFHDLHFEYQSFPFGLSPLQYRKNNYKKFLEEAMSEVEKDIALFEEHEYIYVGRKGTSEQDQKI
uniref:Enkurin domain-containing protein n=1 Tax=Oreochromis aureus TaxID=47969 RepID=A0A668RAR1_OREAU